ncbi:MAG: hypothetical protein FD180_2224 [Planctomycetota bacterium]|nr:MAG: hypothetical protein FD180_2224 [Planctomycetota bacterium]
MRRIAAAFVFALLLAILIRMGAPAAQRAPDAAPLFAAPEEASAIELSAAADPAVSGEKPDPELVQGSSAVYACGSGGCASLKWMVRRQNADGSWGGDPEIFEGRVYAQTSATALCLFALLSAGYTHLSKESVAIEGSESEKTYGETIKAALAWLDARPPSDAFDASLEALVMSEAWGLTTTRFLGPSCEAALARYDAFQRFDGTRGDALAESWAAEAVASARLSGVEFDQLAAERTSTRLKESLDAGPTPEAAAAYLLITKDREHPSLPGLAASLAGALPDWEKPEFTRWYFATLALHQLEGPGHVDPPGESWKAWSQAVKEVLVRNQLCDGTWPGLSGQTGTAVRTAMATMSLEVYYRYSSMLGVK